MKLLIRQEKKQKSSPFPNSSLLAKCIYKIPLCGGFCAPTANPSANFLRHFSNEWTPPQPCLRSRCFRGLFEHSFFARIFGSIGVVGFGDVYRAQILTFAFSLSLVAWCFMIFACFAITSQRSVLSNTHWVKANIDKGSVRMYIGLSHAGFDLRNNGKNSSIPSYFMRSLQNSCDGAITFSSKSYNDQNVRIDNFGDIFYNDDCNTCRKGALSSISLAITNVLSQFVQMTTALQRTTPYGDLNCQKMMGVITGIYGLISTVESLRSFRKNCGLKSDIPPWARSVHIDGYLLDSGDAVSIKVRLNAGIAFTLLSIAIWLKCVDVICHLLVPTPKQKRRKLRHNEPAYSNFEAYLLTATSPQQHTENNNEIEIA